MTGIEQSDSYIMDNEHEFSLLKCEGVILEFAAFVPEFTVTVAR